MRALVRSSPGDAGIDLTEIYSEQTRCADLRL